MRAITLLLLLVITNSVYADLYRDVYKCQSSSKQIIYQAGSCSPNTVNQTVVEIKKLDAQQLEEAENKLKATEAERLALDKADRAEQSRAESARRKLAMTRPVNQNYPRRMYYPRTRYHYRQERRFPVYQPRNSTNQFGFPVSNMHTHTSVFSNRKVR